MPDKHEVDSSSLSWPTSLRFFEASAGRASLRSVGASAGRASLCSVGASTGEPPCCQGSFQNFHWTGWRLFLDTFYGSTFRALVFWGCSSAGRASALQAGGQGFKSPQLHSLLIFEIPGTVQLADLLQGGGPAFSLRLLRAGKATVMKAYVISGYTFGHRSASPV